MTATRPYSLAGDPPGKIQFKEALDQWVEQNPGKLVAIGKDLTEAGYFDNWDLSKWSSSFLHPTTNSYRIQVDTVEDAFDYVSYLRDVILPPLVEKRTRPPWSSPRRSPARTISPPR